MRRNSKGLHRMIIALIFIGSFSLAAKEKGESAKGANSEKGWETLFDGVSLKGWLGYNGVSIEGAWVAENGELHLRQPEEGSVHANLITEKQYDDFDLRFEWKVEKGTNSGVMFRVGEGPKEPYLTGPEYQVLDNLGFRSGKGLPVGPKEHSASHYAIEEATADVTKPIGEWNSGRIRAVGNHVEYWLNGVKTAEYVIGSAKWKEQVANSKFSKWKEFATLSKGHIALQDHGHAVWFRNLKIKKL